MTHISIDGNHEVYIRTSEKDEDKKKTALHTFGEDANDASAFFQDTLKELLEKGVDGIPPEWWQ